MRAFVGDCIYSPQSSPLLAWSAVLAASIGLAACSAPRQPAPNASHTRTILVSNVPPVYVVRRGDTVSAIASRYGLDYRQIGALNGLDSNYTIYPGQRLRLTAQRSVSTVAPRPVYSAPRTSAPVVTRAPQPMPNIPPTNTPNWTAQTWLRPVSGSVIRGFDKSANRLGMWFAAPAGTPVRATQAGTVLYVGSDLPEYGRLVLIQHSNDYISAYAHLGNVLVQEKQTVQAGQAIANVGFAPAVNQSALEFQIRYRGTPINPNQFVR